MSEEINENGNGNGNSNGKLPVPVAYDPGEKADLPVKLDPVTAKKLAVKLKRAAALADANAIELLGSKVLKVKTKHLMALGSYVERLGVRKLGHGTLISASSNAGKAIAECDAIAQELLRADPPCDPELLIALKQLQRDFNQQLIEVGNSHLKADKAVAGVIKDNNISMPFPQGQPMVIAVGAAKPPLSIEAPPDGS